MPLKDAPQYNSQHAVPQNIMDVEFKLIGDLTMRQFFYVLIFFGLAYGVFNIGIPVVIKWPIILALVGAGLGFAFVPIEDRGLDEWIVNFFQAVYSESQMIWHKDPSPPAAFLQNNLASIQHDLITLTPTASRRKLEQYLQDQYQSEQKTEAFEQLEESYIMKVKNAFASFEPSAKQAPTAVIEDSPIITSTETVEPETIESKPSVTTTPSQPPAGDAGPPKKSPPKPKATPQPSLPIPEDRIFVEPITPDRHAGRRFTSMLPSQGTIVLPIRGERVLRTVEEQEPSESSLTKAKQLKDLIDQIKGREQVTQREEAVKVGGEASQLIENLQKENEELQRQIDLLRQGSADTSEIQELEKKSAETVQTIAKLREQVSSLRDQGGSSKLGVIPDHLKQTTANTLAGVVRNFQGTDLSNVLLVIKGSHGDPVRAMKTNDLGEFSVTNPLVNGKYQIETDVNGSTSFHFDIIDFEAKGEIIPPVEIVGK